MRFVVRHLSPGATAVREEVLEAASAAALRQKMAADGNVVLGLRAVRSGLSSGRFDVAWWCRELQTLLRAGMTAVEAIETMAADKQDAERARVHSVLLLALHRGASLSQAMRQTGAFPEVLLASVTASERTGALAESLTDYLRFDEMLQRLRRQATSAALYPLMVTGLGLSVALFLLLFVMPRFSRIYGDLQHAVSPATRAVLWLSSTLADSWPYITALVVGAVLIIAALWRRGRLAPLGAAVLEAVAPLREQADQFRLAKLYQSLALLFKGGYTFDEAMHVCAGLDMGERMQRRAAWARAAMALGKAPSAALSQASLADPTAQRLLHVGERSGDFAAVLLTIGERHGAAFSTFIERATRLVEPLLLLVVALVVGGLIVMMYMPIFDIAGGLGGAP